jgi:amino acid transporter
MSISLTRLLTGRPIANREAEDHKLGVFAGVPAMGLDGLGSAAYGPEAALTILAAAGSAGLGAMVPITWIILLLLAMLTFSYRQTIAAYPGNGGSYVVAKENLGIPAGLLAAAALMVDYMLNVAVGISAGVGALTSAIPSLHAGTLPLCLGILVAITLINLRGTRESGLVLSVPTYLFIASLGGLLLWGGVKMWLAGSHPHPVVAPPPVPHAAATLGLWLLLRAFASGCTAMTGVEAVSNGVSAFREPRVRHAHGTLTVIVVVLAALLFGIGQLARAYGIMAMDQTRPGYQSVLSQLVGAVYGRGWFYYVTIGSVLSVLCLSANTSFVGFPRLCHLVAADGFLPRPFAVAGRRLVYSIGILFLAVGSGCLLAGFGGITDRLIPLFAVGAFLSFTLSQAGMAAHWWRSGGRVRLLINGGGAVATGAALVIILLAKFAEGAWLTVLVIPCIWVALRSVHRYYEGIDSQVLRGRNRRIDPRNTERPAAIVPIARWDQLARKAVEHALRLSPDVTALHVTSLEGPEDNQDVQRLQREWREIVQEPAIEAGLPAPALLLVPSPYRSVVAPLLRVIQELGTRQPGRQVMIVLPELVDGRWWGYLMHTHRERRLRASLLRHGGPGITVVSVPWQLQVSAPEQGLVEEEL